MRFKDFYLNEKWVDSKLINTMDFQGTLEIFKNPSKKEYKEVIKNSKYNAVRGLIMPDGSVYIWDAGVIHNDIMAMNKKFNKAVFSFIYDSDRDILYKDSHYDIDQNIENIDKNKLIKILKELQKKLNTKWSHIYINNFNADVNDIKTELGI